MVFVLPLVGTTHPGHEREIQRVVVIHLDTTRMDDFGCYGGVARTPNIDAVAARGMRYTNSITPIPKTSPSIASFMTGRLPNAHGVYASSTTGTSSTRARALTSMRCCVAVSRSVTLSASTMGTRVSSTCSTR